MWRNKEYDFRQIQLFIEKLQEFRQLKEKKWERIDEKAQMNNPPGIPGEDWINPPDENGVAHELEQDSQYVMLKTEILALIPNLKVIAKFLHFNEHHDFDWVNFNSPLIGNDALEDGLEMAVKLRQACSEQNYVIQNLVSLLR